MATTGDLWDSASGMAHALEIEATMEDVAKAKRSLAGFKGALTTKKKLVEGHRQALESAIAAEDQNDGALLALSNILQDSLVIMLDQADKYQKSVDRYLILAESTDEANSEYFKKLDKERYDELDAVQAEYKKSAAVICQGRPESSPAAATASTNPTQKVVKPEKELKPDHKLAEGDSMET